MGMEWWLTVSAEAQFLVKRIYACSGIRGGGQWVSRVRV